MPKKFGINSKAAEARAREEELKQQRKLAEEKAREDAIWSDSDPSLASKQARAQARAARKQEALQRKQELKALEEAESKANAKLVKAYKPPPRPTQASISAIQDKPTSPSLVTGLSADAPAFQPTSDLDLHEDINPNHLQRAEEAKYAAVGAEVVTVDTIDSALAALEVNPVEKHPEKRMAKAWKDYVDENYPLLKAEFPTLKRSQLMEKLHNDWQKAPENPINKQHAAYNYKASG